MSVLIQHLHTLLLKLVTLWFFIDLAVVMFKIAEVLNFALLYETDINIRARTQIVVDTALNCCDDYFDCFFLAQILFILRLHDSHCCKTT